MNELPALGVLPDQLVSELTRKQLASFTPNERAALLSWRKFYRHIEKTYGSDLMPFGETQYIALYVAQGRRCAICRGAKGQDPLLPLAYANRILKPRRLAVDHNHLTGLVRGLLCSGSTSANTCNRLIGRYTSGQLGNAVEYLHGPPSVEHRIWG